MVSASLIDWGWIPASEIPAAAARVFTPAQAEAALLNAADASGLIVVLRADLLDDAIDPIVEARMRSAPTATIAAAYRVLIGRAGVSAAKMAFQRLSRALNGARYAGLARPPRLLCVPGRAQEDLASGQAEARLALDKLANYQIDLDAIAAYLGKA